MQHGLRDEISQNPVCGKLSLYGEVSVFSSARYGQLHQLCNFSFRGVNGGRGRLLSSASRNRFRGLGLLLVVLLVIAPPSSARPGQVYFCAFRSYFKSRQGVRQLSLLTRRGWRYRQPLATSSSGPGFFSEPLPRPPRPAFPHSP